LTIVVLLILALVWAAVLGPGILRRRAERRSADSIGAFRRQLRVLERTGPPIVQPANRLYSPRPLVVRFGGRTDVPAAIEESRESGGGYYNVALTEREQVVRVGHAGAPVGRGIAVSTGRAVSAGLAPGVCRRRRNVLVSLAGAFLFTGLLGAIPGMHAMLALTLLSGLALVGYVVLLVRLRQIAEERRAKLRYLPTAPRSYETAGVRRVASR
jgi:hypothetical protein